MIECSNAQHNMNNSARSDYSGAIKKTDMLNNIKLNLLSPFYSNLSIFYQRVVTPDYTVQLGVSYMDFTGVLGTSTNSTGSSYYERSSEQTQMVTITPEFHYNLTGQYLSGIYFGSFVRFLQSTYKYDLDSSTYYFGSSNGISHHKSSYTTIGIGVLVGKQLLYKRRVSFDIYAGPVYSILVANSNPIRTNNDLIISDDLSPVMFRGYGIRAGLTVGYAF
jgi:hypothetical protein